MIPALRQAALDRRTHGLTLAVLLWLATELLDPHDFRRVKLETLVLHLGCDKSAASKVLRKLVRWGYLQRREHIDGAEYRLCWTREVSPGKPLDRAAPPSAA